MLKINRKSGNNAVSEVFGTILLLVISVSLFSVVYVTFFSIEVNTPSPAINIVGTIDGNELILEHRGGDPLSLKTEVIIESNGTRQAMILNNEDYLNNSYKNDQRWDIGERFVYPLSSLINFSRFDPVNITVVDRVSNSVIMTGTVSEARVADVQVKITVSDNQPHVYENIVITINASNDKGPSDAQNVTIKYLLPSYLKHVHNTSGGTYDNSTGIWEVGDIAVGSYVTIDITVTVLSYAYNPQITQFVLLLDGSKSIDPDSWEDAIEGIKEAVDDANVFPSDGTVELTIIQFGVKSGFGGPPEMGVCARLEVGPVVVKEYNSATVVGQINDLKDNQGKGYTPTAAAIYYASDILSGSINFGGFNPNYRQVILLVTDGNANVYSEPGQLCGTNWGNKDLGQSAASSAATYLRSVLLMTSNQDEFNVIAVDDQVDKDWLCNDIVWPKPCFDGTPPPEEDNGWPPPGPGWYKYCSDYDAFKAAVKNLFTIMFRKIDNRVSIQDATYMDPNLVNNLATISIYPQP